MPLSYTSGFQVEILLPRDDQVHACVIHRMNLKQSRGKSETHNSPIWVASTPPKFLSSTGARRCRLLLREDASPYHLSWLVHLIEMPLLLKTENRATDSKVSHQDFGLKKDHLILLRSFIRTEGISVLACVCKVRCSEVQMACMPTGKRVLYLLGFTGK